MKPRHMAMLAALVLAGGLVVFGDKTPSSGVAEPVERSARSARPGSAPADTTSANAAKAGKTAAADPAIARLIPRAELIGDDDDIVGGKGGVFGAQNWNPPLPPASANLANAAPPPPPPPPTAPPLPFAFLGKAAEKGEWEVYLSRGERTYIVKNKMVIDGVYRVDAIAPPTLTLTYLPLNQVQQINIGVLD